jgi:AcrR family transcriptional regulator
VADSNGNAVEGSARSTSRRGPTREAAEAALIKAALELLDERGALDKMSLREIAERAGVHRGLVYHYFGSREELLREAARRLIAGRKGELAEDEELPFAARMTRMLESALGYPEAGRLSVLLVLDHDETVRTLPFRRQALPRIRDDMERGGVALDDPEALYALVCSVTYGFLLMGERFAQEMGCDHDDLRARVLATCHTLFASVDAEAAPTPT